MIVVFRDGGDVQLRLIRYLAIRFVLQLSMLRLRLLELRRSDHWLLDALQMGTGTGASSSTGIASMGPQGGTLVHIGRHLVSGSSDRLRTDTHILRVEPVEAVVANVTWIFIREGCG